MKKLDQISVGIDGAPGGWCAALLGPDRKVRLEAVPRGKLTGWLQQLMTIRGPDLRRPILIDCPIGLPDADRPRRVCDSLTRRALSPAGSRCFSHPPRDAMEASDFRQAQHLARLATGIGISIQAWNLAPAIREAEEAALALVPDVLRESHPELVFLRLGGHILPSKHRPEGRQQRAELLAQWLGASLLERLPRLGGAAPSRSDAHDALVLAIAASRELTALPAEPQPDALGLPCQIWAPVASEKRTSSGAMR